MVCTFLPKVLPIARPFVTIDGIKIKRGLLGGEDMETMVSAAIGGGCGHGVLVFFDLFSLCDSIPVFTSYL